MQLSTIIIYFILSLALFFILNYFDSREKENNMIHAILPIVYILILAGIFSATDNLKLNDNIFMIVIMELLIRIYYIKSILKQEILMNTKFYVQIYMVAILGSYFLNLIFISKVDIIFPSASEMRMGIWFLVVLFIYLLFKNYLNIQVTEQKSTFISKKKQYAIIQYARLKSEYYRDIKLKNKDLIPLFYAMLVYENYKRPALYRKLDRIIYRFTGAETKMGIMQIKSRSEISDLESIKLAQKKLTQLDNSISATKNKNKEILIEYYGEDNEYVTDILDIYNEIILFDKN